MIAIFGKRYPITLGAMDRMITIYKDQSILSKWFICLVVLVFLSLQSQGAGFKPFKSKTEKAYKAYKKGDLEKAWRLIEEATSKGDSVEFPVTFHYIKGQILWESRTKNPDDGSYKEDLQESLYHFKRASDNWLNDNRPKQDYKLAEKIHLQEGQLDAKLNMGIKLLHDLDIDFQKNLIDSLDRANRKLKSYVDLIIDTYRPSPPPKFEKLTKDFLFIIPKIFRSNGRRLDYSKIEKNIKMKTDLARKEGILQKKSGLDINVSKIGGGNNYHFEISVYKPNDLSIYKDSVSNFKKGEFFNGDIIEDFLFFFQFSVDLINSSKIDGYKPIINLEFFGMSDSIPIISPLKYMGEFGDIINENAQIENTLAYTDDTYEFNLESGSVFKDNIYLAFLRAYSIYHAILIASENRWSITHDSHVIKITHSEKGDESGTFRSVALKIIVDYQFDAFETDFKSQIKEAKILSDKINILHKKIERDVKLKLSKIQKQRQKNSILESNITTYNMMKYSLNAKITKLFQLEDLYRKATHP